jgi:hypothetical protein
MTLKDAKALRDEIISWDGTHCTVPLGFGPDRYFARIFRFEGPVDFHARAEFRTYKARQLREHRAKLRMYDALERIRPPRSPIELMIDRACGLA